MFTVRLVQQKLYARDSHVIQFGIEKAFLLQNYYSSFPVPPQKPLIHDDRGRQVDHVGGGVGPYREGDSLTLDCHVAGGRMSYKSYHSKIKAYQLILVHVV